MLSPKSLLVSLLCLFSSAEAKYGTIGMGIVMYHPVCVYSCHDSLSSLYLNCTTFDDSMGHMSGMDMKVRKRMDMGGEAMGTTSDECYATNVPWLQTLAYCFKTRCAADGTKDDQIERHWQDMAANGATVASYKNSIPTNAPTTELEADATWLNLTSLVNGENYLANHLAMSEFEFQEDMHVRLSVILMILSVAGFLIAGAYKAFSMSSHASIVPTALSKKLLLPALFNGRHQTPLPMELGYAPSRQLSLFVALYVFLNLIFSAVPYKSVRPNAWFSDSMSEVATYVANRTGVLSFANIALAILFAGRNNPLIALSRLSQTTFLIVHRWAARVATIQAIVHSIIYTCTYFWSGGAAAYYTEFKMPYYWWGVIATIALSFGAVFSVLPIRVRAYEVFLITHILMAILALVGCWYHIDIRFTKKWGYEVWLYIAFAFWGFERLSRIVSIVYRNMMGTTTQATAEIVSNGQFIKLTVFPGKTWKFAPGQHVFLLFPSTGRFWESHPFSVASYSGRCESTTENPSSTSPSLAGDLEKTANSEIAPVPSISSTSENNSPPRYKAPNVTFIIRPSKGLTQSLLRNLQFQGQQQIPISLTIEGPYGHAANLKNVDRILCIAGGIGITALMPYVQEFVASRRAGTSRAQRLVLVFSYREIGLEGVVRSLLPDDAENFGVEFVLHCTAAELDRGRMNVGETIRAEAVSVKRLAVLVCAPGSMADTVRREVVDVTGQGEVKIDLHEDSFAW